MLAAHWEGNPNVVYCKAKGSGGADEMTGALEDNEVMYGLGKLLSRLDGQIARWYTLLCVHGKSFLTLRMVKTTNYV